MARAEAGAGAPAVRACPLGCAEPGSALGELDKTAGFALSRERYTLALCGCGKLVYLSPAPSEADLRAMYVDHGQFGEEYTDAARVKAILDYIGQCFDRLSKAGGWAAPVRVLEVGAGLAWMCRAAKVRDQAHFTVAQDVSPEALAACPWVDRYVQAEVGDPRIAANGPYQLISMTHVIEHLVDPAAVVRKCRALLAADGFIFITAPHRPRGWREGDMQAWRAYSYNHVPAHIQYFSEASMRRLAQASGCELAYWSHDHEGGEAFEAWLAPASTAPRAPWWRRMVASLRG
ncbi:MAG TPA: class I SAM-dependent methyltransferase [Usitatibacter sp.]